MQISELKKSEAYREFQAKLKVIAKLNGWEKSPYISERYRMRYEITCSTMTGKQYDIRVISFDDRITHCVNCKFHCFIELGWI